MHPVSSVHKTHVSTEGSIDQYVHGSYILVYAYRIVYVNETSLASILIHISGKRIQNAFKHRLPFLCAHFSTDRPISKRQTFHPTWLHFE